MSYSSLFKFLILNKIISSFSLILKLMIINNHIINQNNRNKYIRIVNNKENEIASQRANNMNKNNLKLFNNFIKESKNYWPENDKFPKLKKFEIDNGRITDNYEYNNIMPELEKFIIKTIIPYH